MLTKILALAALALMTSSSALAAAAGCHAISGTYVSHNVPCVVPAIVCVESQTTGDLAGVSTTVVTTFDPATNTFSGTTTNVLDNGAILESTIVGTTLNGVGHSVETITGGTRQFAHATGTILTGSVDRVGSYTGEYCLGNGGEGD
jgi:hypothetical protein